MKITTNELQYIHMFESATNASLKDCIVMDDNEVVLVVEKGDMGLAIGRNGENIERIRNMTGKSVSLVEYSPDPAQFIRNLFAPVELESVDIKNGVALVKLKNRADGGRAIGRDGKRIKRAKNLLERHHGIGVIKIIERPMINRRSEGEGMD